MSPGRIEASSAASSSAYRALGCPFSPWSIDCQVYCSVACSLALSLLRCLMRGMPLLSPHRLRACGRGCSRLVSFLLFVLHSQMAHMSLLVSSREVVGNSTGASLTTWSFPPFVWSSTTLGLRNCASHCRDIRPKPCRHAILFLFTCTLLVVDLTCIGEKITATT